MWDDGQQSQRLVTTCTLCFKESIVGEESNSILKDSNI